MANIKRFNTFKVNEGGNPEVFDEQLIKQEKGLGNFIEDFLSNMAFLDKNAYKRKRF